MNPSIKKLTLVCGEFVSVSVFSKAKYHVPFFYELFFLILTHDNILNHKKSVIIFAHEQFAKQRSETGHTSECIRKRNVCDGLNSVALF